MEIEHTFALHAPEARTVTLVVARGGTKVRHTAIRSGTSWLATTAVVPGDDYWYEVDGVGPLLDPHAADIRWTDDGPRSVVRTSWPSQPSLGRHHADPIIYEMHVRGFARTFAGVRQRLDHLVDLGVNVIELMPVHPFDPSDNYWGYMPLVWGAVHRLFADDQTRAPEELAELVAAAHARDIEVWLDVVFNHTGEGDASLPTRCLRGIDNAHAYRHHPDGRYMDDSGCGNDANPADPEIRRLVIEALDRFATLGIDGFRFDLASLLTRDDGGMVEGITAWGRRRGVRLIAEPWDLAAYQVGSHLWPADWLQWNDRFRDDVRGFLRAEEGLVPAMVQRVQGSPDLFDASVGVPSPSINFVTAHDGLTMHDLTIVTSDGHRSWDCGSELRLQQVQNYFIVLLLSAGSPMFVMGDEFGRTQGGHDNPYNIDSEVSWVDWARLDEWRELYWFVQHLLLLRREALGDSVTCFGVDGPPDTSYESRSLAWHSGDLYVMVNAWWEPLTFEVQVAGDWHVAAASAPTDGRTLAPRSSVVLRRVVSV
jgi:glycogen operon protein